MKRIDEIYAIVEESSHETAFNYEECVGLYKILNKLTTHATIVEVGVEFGRSTTVIAEWHKEHFPSSYFTAIDDLSAEESIRAHEHVQNQMKKHQWRFDYRIGQSTAIAELFTAKIDLIHIDGDHTHEGVIADCIAWLGKVKVGGYALFDDYGHESLPTVKKAIDEYMYSHKEWKFREIYGNKLAVFQKIK